MSSGADNTRRREPKAHLGVPLRPYRYGKSRLVLDLETGEFRKREVTDESDMSDNGNKKGNQ